LTWVESKINSIKHHARALIFSDSIVPAVPQGQQLLRTSYMATHTDEQLNRALEIYESVGKQLGLI